MFGKPWSFYSKVAAVICVLSAVPVAQSEERPVRPYHARITALAVNSSLEEGIYAGTGNASHLGKIAESGTYSFGGERRQRKGLNSISNIRERLPTNRPAEANDIGDFDYSSTVGRAQDVPDRITLTPAFRILPQEGRLRGG
jgi:hypothetical protein